MERTNRAGKAERPAAAFFRSLAAGVAAAVGASLLAAGCETGVSSGQSANTNDFIRILSVEPEKPTAGVTNDIAVTVEYSLDSSYAGELNAGFNTGRDPEWYYLDPAVTTNVYRGQGQHVFSFQFVPAPRDDGAPFAVYASLSTALHSVPWAPLADDSLFIELE